MDHEEFTEHMNAFLANGGKKKVQEAHKMQFTIIYAVIVAVLGGGGFVVYKTEPFQDRPTEKQVERQIEIQLARRDVILMEKVEKKIPSPEVKQALSYLAEEVADLKSEVKETQSDVKAMAKTLYRIESRLP